MSAPVFPNILFGSSYVTEKRRMMIQEVYFYFDQEGSPLANILDYLDWRGDLSFTAAPFNEVDNLIFSQLCFLDLDNLVPDDPKNGSVRLEHAIDRYFERHPIESASLGMIVPADILKLADRARHTARFRNVCVTGFVNQIDRNVELQFSATTYLLGDGTAYVAFRGTDDTLVGWKEDFNMAFTPTIPAQASATKYLNAVLSALPQALHLGGHSKGGNLAVYAAIHADPADRTRILDVYSNDGPGFYTHMLTSEAYRTMQSKIRSIVPESSIDGRLLDHEEPYRIVKSTAKGLFQHDGFSWELIGDKFCTLQDRSDESKRVDRTLKLWLSQMNNTERANFIDSVYDLLSATNAQTLTELNADRKALLASLRNIDPKAREMLIKLVLLIADQSTRSFFEKKEREKDKKEKAKLPAVKKNPKA